LIALTEKPKSSHGGKREGAGAKRDPLKDLRTGALTAQKILKQINDEKEIPILYAQLNPAQKLSAIFKLRDCAYGRPGTSEEQAKPPVPVQINVNVRRIGA